LANQPAWPRAPRRARSSSASASIFEEFSSMRARALWFGLVLVTVAALDAGAGAATRRPVKIDDFSRLQDVGDPQVSPDGDWVLYTLTTTDAGADRRRTDVWKVKWDGSGQSRLTYGSGNETSARWSPDGKYISFLSGRPGGEARGTQVWLLDRTGGEAHQLTQLKGRIASYEWSPDATPRGCCSSIARVMSPTPSRRAARPDRSPRRSRW
jgi:tricorn protease-like protein